jgi:hypothetical protein
LQSSTTSIAAEAVNHHQANAADMAAMFSQNPLMNGPNYSFSDAPKTRGEPREHAFNP